MDQTLEDAYIDLRAAVSGRGESLEAMYEGDRIDYCLMAIEAIKRANEQEGAR